MLFLRTLFLGGVASVNSKNIWVCEAAGNCGAVSSASREQALTISSIAYYRADTYGTHPSVLNGTRAKGLAVMNQQL